MRHERGRIRVTIDEAGKISWQRGGEGMTLKQFVESYPCEALSYLVSHITTDIHDPLLSVLGGQAGALEFKKVHNCETDDNLLQQL